MSIADQMEENRKIAEQQLPLKLKDDYCDLLDEIYELPEGTHTLQAGVARRAATTSTK